MTTNQFASYDLISDTASNRPATPTVGNGRLVVFQATDTGTLSIWNGTAWVDHLANTTTGKVLASGTPPTWTATPTLTSVTFGSGTALSAYQEGTWTPVDGSGQGVTMGVVYATYTIIGRVVMLNFRYAPSGGTTAQASASGLPFNGASSRSQTGIVTTSAGTPVNCGVNGTVCGMANASTGAIITNTTLAGQAVIPACAYSTT